MATPFRVPDTFKQPLAKLLDLPDKDAVALDRVLEKAPPTLLARDLAKRISAETAIEARDAEQLSRLLISLYSLRETTEEPIPEFVESVCESAQATGLKELSKDSPNWPRFKDRLAKLLSFTQSIGVASKAHDVMTEHEHVLCDMRILTDVRAIFNPDPKEPPAAVVITHQLKIAYHEGGATKEFYVAMDSEDLRTLKKLVERANHKEQSLRTLIEATKVPVLDSETH
jgi:hypothetical protein